ncbi:MAG: hypothetical protein ACD_73C00613G0001 [uncultured bacterium]|nr:MAG: hypothetical protein ACD_73C00613G0001 [uncultured bacterium]
MSGIAEVLLNLGYPVSGTDQKSSTITRRLKKRGATIHYGHKGEHVIGSDVVVVSSAIKKENPEYVTALENKIPIISRAEMLAELMRFSKFGIAVAGTHGKTTTTSLVASVLYAGGLDPTMIIGGKVNHFRTNARLGKGDFMVAEADESDGSFLKLDPSIAVITNIDREHMDFYGSFAKVKKAFVDFAGKVPFYGAVICCGDHPVVKELIPQMSKRVITYGLSDDVTWQARDIHFENGFTQYELFVNGEKKDTIKLNLLGEHNVRNSLATLIVANELGISQKKSNQALSGFKGIHRRLEVLYKSGDNTLIDDYGHHPEEIKATLQAIRMAYSGPLITIFQPHRYTRTFDLLDDFKKAFSKTDDLYITDIYAAGEAPIEGVSASRLVAQIAKKHKGRVGYLPKNKALADEIFKLIEPGAMVLFLGAGDITYIASEVAKKMVKKYGKHIND